ncbi:hypothetical protein XhyaCFBP1156_10225 [Xanthomonas hyacinthi]|uniref:Uncharacterized protein n=1 Tax=Xanthomonas hyacinthi TaxID=56455 RepID=A0A2S7EX30_9XANT|nr:hypothetical protein Y886_01420 [Xanthomonas hyacinthi DSM 19077]PPU97718.1 hypothetical protein XhyaCFBP1156_10225 [Xanthomonas hyacinthi]
MPGAGGLVVGRQGLGRDEPAASAPDPDECFRRLFGDAFARAYEAQLVRLQSARRAGKLG